MPISPTVDHTERARKMLEREREIAAAPLGMSADEALALATKWLARELADFEAEIIARSPAPPGTAQWARVELFGHRMHWGLTREVDAYGTKMLQISVPGPKPGEFAAHVLYGGSSIFSFLACTEERARKATADQRRWGGLEETLLLAAPPEHRHREEPEDRKDGPEAPAVERCPGGKTIHECEATEHLHGIGCSCEAASDPDALARDFPASWRRVEAAPGVLGWRTEEVPTDDDA